MLDDSLKIITASRSFYQTFQVTPTQIHGISIFTANDGQLNIPELRAALETKHFERNPVDTIEIKHNFKKIGSKVFIIDLRWIFDDNKNCLFVLLAIEDATNHTCREILINENRFKEAVKLAFLGHWELDLTTDTLYWSDEIYRIFEMEPRQFGATYKDFLSVVHPGDRELVHDAFTKSVKNKTGYDIVHRLLLKDGRVKYVHEKCKTKYDEKGKAIRSLGTVQDITERTRTKQNFAGIVGSDPKMKEIFGLIRDLTYVNAPVMIQGESGTGKELVAAAVHNKGPRAKKPFVPVNCSALPEGLLESELFGYVKGAFTGAVRDKKGRFELADGGTLFLDEIGDLPKAVQAKLLRALQEGTFERIGDEKTISVDVRLICATNRDLKQEVLLGNFRDDLFYRVNVVPIYLPPLRERKNDIPLLAEDFLEKIAQEGRVSSGISGDALAAMIDYSWPGNVRELQNAIQFALIKSKGREIQPEHLPPETMKIKLSSRGPCQKLNLEDVRSALAKTGGNKTKAAKMLGVGRATLYRFLASFPEDT